MQKLKVTNTQYEQATQSKNALEAKRSDILFCVFLVMCSVEYNYPNDTVFVTRLVLAVLCRVQAQRELDKLRITLQQIAEFNEKVKGEILVTRRYTSFPFLFCSVLAP
jgi:hypothetical protein